MPGGAEIRRRGAGSDGPALDSVSGRWNASGRQGGRFDGLVPPPCAHRRPEVRWLGSTSARRSEGPAARVGWAKCCARDTGWDGTWPSRRRRPIDRIRPPGPIEREAGALAAFNDPKIAASTASKRPEGAFPGAGAGGGRHARRAAARRAPAAGTGPGLALEIASVLKPLTRRGSCYRDRKPANIKADAGRQVKVLELRPGEAFEPDALRRRPRQLADDEHGSDGARRHPGERAGDMSRSRPAASRWTSRPTSGRSAACCSSCCPGTRPGPAGR